MGDVDRALNRDPDVCLVQRRRIIDAVAEVADDMPAPYGAPR